MVKIPRNKLEDGGHRDEKGLGQKRRRMTTEDRSAWRGNSNVGTPMRGNHGDDDGFGMTNSEDDEDSEATASRDDAIFVMTFNIQGDTSRCFKPPVDFDVKVVF